MKKRIISTICLWTGVILLLTLGGNTGGLLLILVASGLTQWELYGLLEKMDCRPRKQLGVLLGTLLLLGSYYLPSLNGGNMLALMVVVLAATTLTLHDLRRVLLPTAFGLLYVPFMFHFFGQLLQLQGNLFLPVWVIAVAKFSDVGGLLIGSRWGRNKLAPAISPGKTVEGAIGGIFTSVLIGLILLLLPFSFPVGVFKAAFIAACLGVIAIISDLVESIFKRQAGVKDSGQLIPGIGGAFDLTDSLILSAPLAYLLISLLQ